MAAGGCRSTGPVDRQSNWQIAVGLGRPAAKGKFRLELSVDRPGRPTKNREQAASSRSTDRRAQNMHALISRLGRPARPRMDRSTGPVDRQA